MHRGHILMFLVFLHVSGLLIFSRGFFLTRRAVIEQSSCSSNDSLVSIINQESLSHKINRNSNKNLASLLKLEKFGDDESSSICWRSPRFKKVIMLLIDALRFDFTESRDGIDIEKDLPFINKMPVFHSLCVNDTSRCLKYRFVADAPTTTSQRLKGLTTGGLPTFLELSSNFDSDVLYEDNIIHQFSRMGKRVVFMGDDTWTSMFPSTFFAQIPFPSFNVWDLDSVDNGILHELPNYTNPNSSEYRSDWEVVIAHFLGVDHAGHRYGPFHPEMRRKLMQINQVIDDIASNLRNDTLLVVFGDHGMTNDGNHGGSTPNEVNAALFVYAKNKCLNDTAVWSALHPLPNDESVTVHQVDLVPTLSLLLGSPIPYGSIGSIIPELMAIDPDGFSPHGSLQSFEKMISVLHSLRLNILQVSRFIETYLFPDIDSNIVLDLNAKKLIFDESFRNSFDAIGNMEDDSYDLDGNNILQIQLETYHLGKQYLQYVGKISRSAWATFDLFLMCSATVLMFGSFIAGYTFLQRGAVLIASPLSPPSVPGWATPSLTILSGCVVVFSNSIISGSFWGGSLSEKDLLSFAVGAIVAQLFLSVDRHNIAPIKLFFPNSFECLVAILCLISHAAFAGSNSLVIMEDSLVSFLCTSGIFIYGRAVLKTPGPKFLLVLLLVGMLACVRVISPFIIRRQFGTHAINKGSNKSIFLPIIQTYIPLIVGCVLFILSEMKRSEIITGLRRGKGMTRATWILVGLIVPFTTFLTGLQWTIFPEVDNAANISSKVIFPRIIYLLSSSSILFLLLYPNIFMSDCRRGGDGYVTIVLLLVALLFPIACLLMGPVYPFSLCIMLIQFGLLLEITSVLRIRTSSIESEKSIITAFPTSGYSVIFWFLTATLFFLGTGHQMTFSTLQITSSMVGLEDFNFILSGINLALNTFLPFIIAMLSVPLLGLWRPILLDDSVIVSKTTPNDSVFNVSTQLIVVQFLVLSVYGVIICVCQVVLRRHLMVWAIFAPKFCFSALVILVCDVFLCISFWLVNYVSSFENIIKMDDNSSLSKSSNFYNRIGKRRVI